MKKAFGLVSASLLLLGTGCIPTPQAMIEKVVEQKINQELKGEGTVDLAGNGVTINNEFEGTSARFGDNVALPADFPKDIPIIDGAKIVGVAVTNSDGSWVTMTTDKSVEESAAWYDDQLKKDAWVLSASYAAGGMSTKMYERDNLGLTVIVAAGENGEPNSIMVTESIAN